MASNLSVNFALKTSSAQDFDDLLDKSGAWTDARLFNRALIWYTRADDLLRHGYALVLVDEYDETLTHLNLHTDLGGRNKGRHIISLPETAAANIKNDMSSGDLSRLFTDALYLYDRIIDGQMDGKIVAAVPLPQRKFAY